MNKDSLAGILQGFLGLLMIKVKSHVSVGTPTDFCQDVTRITDEHAISTVVFPWEHGSTNPSSQLARAEKMMRATPCQVCLNPAVLHVFGECPLEGAMYIKDRGGDDVVYRRKPRIIIPVCFRCIP